MRKIYHAKIGLSVFIVTASGSALSTCPNTMPLELLTDCIVYENAGTVFPTSDYANMDRYQEWLKAQPPAAMFPPETAVLPKIR